MTFVISHGRFGVLARGLAAALPATTLLSIACELQAQNMPVASLNETVVTATRSARPATDVVADVTIIDRAEIERAGPVGLADVLARVPGIELARNGGPAHSTSIFVRGGEGRHTAVLVNGVRLDSQTTSGGAAWNAIPLAQIDRIEVVRGPASAVYGSDSVAGVIQIFTKKGEGAFTPVVALNYGSFHTRRTDFSASGSNGAFDYSFGLSDGASQGFDVRPRVAPPQTPDPDADGYQARSANARLGYQLAGGHRLEVNLLQSRVEAQYDNTFDASKRDYRRINTVQTLGLQLASDWTANYSTKIGISRGKDSGEESIGGGRDESRIGSVLLHNEYRSGPHLLSAAIERRTDDFLLTDTPRIDRRKSQTGTALGYTWSQDAHTLQLSARHDSDEEVGGKTTGSAAYALALNPVWKAHASAGTSFRVPTLYQRFSQYGAAGLQPESGRNLEAGLKYQQGSSVFSVTAYRNRLTNLLSFLSGQQASSCPSPALGCYANTAKAQYQGITFAAAQRLGMVGVYGSLDLQDPRDQVLDKQLPRRARRHMVLGADTQLGGWQVGADMLLSSQRFDNAANTRVLPGYAVVNLSASTALSRDWKLSAKLENLTDKVYETAGTYAMPRRGVYTGLTWAPR